VTGNFPLAIAVGFVMGVLGPILIHEIFIRFNPVASWWFGRKAETPAKKEPTEVKEDRKMVSSSKAPVTEFKEP
jgi:hypothetical protein